MMIKRFIQLFIILFFIVLLSVVGLIHVIDPNDYKVQIALKIERQIERPVMIRGDISWHFWPTVGFTIKKIEVGQREAHKHPEDPFVTISQLSVDLALMSLLKRGLNLDTIKLQDTVLHWEHATFTIKNLNATLKPNQNITWNASTILAIPAQHYQWQVESIGNYHQDAGQTQVQIKNINTPKKQQEMVVGFNTKTNHITIDQVYFPQIDMQLISTLIDLVPSHIIVENLYIDEAEIFGIELKGLSTHLDINQKIIHMAPLEAEVYSGKLSGQTILDLHQNMPLAEIDVDLIEGSLDAVLTHMAADNQITGIINADLYVKTHGINSDDMKHNAKGITIIDIRHCLYHGSNYWDAVDKSLGSINNLQDFFAIIKDTNELIEARIIQNTQSNNITGKLQIEQGEVNYLDLMINQQTPIKRYGKIDIPHELIHLCMPF